MNKYQEALKLAYEMMNNADFGSALKGCEALKVLQEPVDKATPKKVLKYARRQPAALCKNCYCGVNKIMNKYCSNCGQKLDWSDEDDR